MLLYKTCEYVIYELTISRYLAELLQKVCNACLYL